MIAGIAGRVAEALAVPGLERAAELAPLALDGAKALVVVGHRVLLHVLS